MDTIIDKYYIGYEGEPEIQIIRKTVQGDVFVLRIWSGFFDDIMNAVEPEEKGWSSLAYYYNLYSGWYEESPWLLQDINAAVEQLKSVKENKLSASRGSMNVLIEIIKVLEDAVKSGDSILIAYE